MSDGSATMIRGVMIQQKSNSCVNWGANDFDLPSGLQVECAPTLFIDSMALDAWGKKKHKSLWKRLTGNRIAVGLQELKALALLSRNISFFLIKKRKNAELQLAKLKTYTDFVPITSPSLFCRQLKSS